MALPAAIALSGLNEEYFSDGLDDIFNRGSVLLKSPSMSSLASTDSQESGISSMSSETSVVRNLASYFDLLFKTTDIELKGVDDVSEPAQPAPPPEEKPEKTEIVHEKRNILDLAANLEWKWALTPAVLQSGPSYFFENRSQYSRVLGAQMPEHVTVTCSFDDCSFVEAQYE